VTASKLTIIPSSTFDKDKFHPAGVSAYEGDDGRILLYAASLATEQVDVFEISVKEKTAKHLRVIRDPLFHALDDLILTSENSFYITNIFRFRNPNLQIVEMVLPLSLGTVVYYDGKTAKEVLTGLQGPNGIELSPDKKQLYVTVTLAKELHIYDIQPDHSLKLRETFFLNTGIDNLHVDDEGSIWAGAHPISYQSGLQFLDPANTITPSQVLKIKLLEKNSNISPQITEIYADPGTTFKGSSVAIPYKGRLVVGSIFDKMLLCELKCQ